MGWRIHPDTTPAAKRVVIEEELDLYGAPAFAREMLALLEGGARALHFDAHALRYLDSTGVGAIIRILQASRARQASLVWEGIGGMPRRVLAMSNILPLLKEPVAKGSGS